jgi:hypothetical protein
MTVCAIVITWSLSKGSSCKRESVPPVTISLLLSNPQNYKDSEVEVCGYLTRSTQADSRNQLILSDTAKAQTGSSEADYSVGLVLGNTFTSLTCLYTADHVLKERRIESRYVTVEGRFLGCQAGMKPICQLQCQTITPTDKLPPLTNAPEGSPIGDYY